MTRPRRIRRAGELAPDYTRPRWTAPPPVGRMPPFIFVIGIDGGTLVTSIPRRDGAPRKLTPAELATVDRVHDQLASRPPASDVWIDPTALTTTPAEVTDAWLRRRTADYVAFDLTL
jgi:hypothetical protein